MNGIRFRDRYFIIEINFLACAGLKVVPIILPPIVTSLNLPPNVLQYFSEQLLIPLAEIYSIATFYTQFKLNKMGENIIVCCDGTACHVKRGPLLLNFLENL